MIPKFAYKLSADDLEDALQILIDVNSLNVKLFKQDGMEADAIAAQALMDFQMLLLDELIARVN